MTHFRNFALGGAVVSLALIGCEPADQAEIVDEPLVEPAPVPDATTTTVAPEPVVDDVDAVILVPAEPAEPAPVDPGGPGDAAPRATGDATLPAEEEQAQGPLDESSETEIERGSDATGAIREAPADEPLLQPEDS